MNNNMYDNNTVSIESYYVLHNGKNMNKFGSYDTICNTFDSLYFVPGKSYTFESTVTFSWNNKTVSKSDSITMTANKRASDGYCFVSPQSGTTLIDWFNFHVADGLMKIMGIIQYITILLNMNPIHF